MPKLKALLAAATAALTYASHIALPAPYGALVAAALAACAYVANHDALVAAVSRVAKVGLVAIACVVACACSGTFTEARLAGAQHAAVSIDPPACAAIDASRRTWGATSEAAAVAAGASGVAAIPVTDRGARIAVASAGAAIGVFAAFAKVESDSFAADWVRECGATAVAP